MLCTPENVASGHDDLQHSVVATTIHDTVQFSSSEADKSVAMTIHLPSARSLRFTFVFEDPLDFLELVRLFTVAKTRLAERQEEHTRLMALVRKTQFGGMSPSDLLDTSAPAQLAEYVVPRGGAAAIVLGTEASNILTNASKPLANEDQSPQAAPATRDVAIQVVDNPSPSNAVGFATRQAISAPQLGVTSDACPDTGRALQRVTYEAAEQEAAGSPAYETFVIKKGQVAVTIAAEAVGATEVEPADAVEPANTATKVGAVDAAQRGTPVLTRPGPPSATQATFVSLFLQTHRTSLTLLVSSSS